MNQIFGSFVGFFFCFFEVLRKNLNENVGRLFGGLFQTLRRYNNQVQMIWSFKWLKYWPLIMMATAGFIPIHASICIGHTDVFQCRGVCVRIVCVSGETMFTPQSSLSVNNFFLNSRMIEQQPLTFRKYYIFDLRKRKNVIIKS